MRLSAVYALRQAAKDGFLIVHNDEMRVLDSLPCWMNRLFTALLRCTDFSSGKGETSYANLVALLRPIQPRRGPRFYVPDLQAVKKAVRILEDRGLLARDKRSCQDEDRLIFTTRKRFTSARLIRKLEPRTRTTGKASDTNSHRGSKAAGGETRSPNSNPLSGVNPLHSGEELSTGSTGAQRAGAAPKFGPPRGPDRGSPQGDPTPPGPTYAARRILAGQRGNQVAPQGAGTSPPQGGHAPGAALPPSARIRRPSNTVLTVDVGETSGGPSGP